MKKTSRLEEHARDLLRLIGQHLKRHCILMIVVTSVIILANVAITLGWYFSPDKVNELVESAFYVIQGMIFAVTIAALITLIFVRLGKISDSFLAVGMHLYAVFLMVWVTIVF